MEKVLKSQLKRFDIRIGELLKSDVKFIDLIVRYTLRIKGKRVRPILTIGTATLFGEVQDRTIDSAITMEILHNATLMHDDVVDGAEIRRKRWSVNKIWNNKTAILFGDYLLANSLISILKTKDFRVMDILSSMAETLSKGELMQVIKAKRAEADEDNYYKIIEYKTASLISACCEIGAVTAGADDRDIELMRLFGETIGIAFQIRDDILDFTGSTSIFGKVRGKDIMERKITLPLIYGLKQASKRESKDIVKRIKRRITDSREIEKIIDFTHKHGGIEYAERKVEELTKKAQTFLNEVRVKDKDMRSALIAYTNSLVGRKV